MATTVCYICGRTIDDDLMNEVDFSDDYNSDVLDVCDDCRIGEHPTVPFVTKTIREPEQE